MSNFTFELNREGVKELLKSEEMMNVCKSYAEDIQSRYDGPSEISEYVGKNRVNVSIEIPYEDALDNGLLKAVR